MQTKSKSRKSKSENGASLQHAPVSVEDLQPATESNVSMAHDDDHEAGPETGRKSRKKKKAAPAPVAAPVDNSSRENVRTVKDRLKELPALPSLESSLPPPDVDALSGVDTNAAPPPAPAPAPESEPLPSNMID